MLAAVRPDDYFASARRVAAAGLVLAALLAIAGTFLPWVSITNTPDLVPGADFGEDVEIEAPRTEPFNGIEVRDGWWVLAGAALFALAGTLLVTRARGAGWGFAAALLVGGIAMADYRGIRQLARDAGVAGMADPGIGLLLVAAAAVVGLVAAVAGMAASPRTDRS